MKKSYITIDFESKKTFPHFLLSSSKIFCCCLHSSSLLHHPKHQPPKNTEKRKEKSPYEYVTGYIMFFWKHSLTDLRIEFVHK